MNSRSPDLAADMDPNLARLLEILNATIDADLDRVSASTRIRDLLETRGLSQETLAFAVEGAFGLDQMDERHLVPGHDLGTLCWRLGAELSRGRQTDF